MTICKLCGKEIKKTKDRRTSAEPEWGKHPECERKEGMIYIKNRLDNNVIIRSAIDALIECNEDQFMSTRAQLRLNRKLQEANEELREAFPYLREKSNQTKLMDFDHTIGVGL